MAISTAQVFRRRIADLHMRAVAVPTGDGLASAFQLAGYPIPSGTAQSEAGSATVIAPWTAAYSFTWNYGVVVFNSIPSAGSAVGTAVYFHSVFSDEEINQILSRNGNNYEKSHLEVIENLMSDAWKRARWAAPGGLEYDDSKALDNLKKMHDILYKKLNETLTTDIAGGPESWAEKQAEWI